VQGAYHGKLDRALAASGRADASPALTNKCQIIFTISDQPGALQAVLALFHTYRVNMTRIESRPSKGPMSSTYDFVVDFDGKVRLHRRRADGRVCRGRLRAAHLPSW
jgi:prephenate dehydratase